MTNEEFFSEYFQEIMTSIHGMTSDDTMGFRFYCDKAGAEFSGEIYLEGCTNADTGKPEVLCTVWRYERVDRKIIIGD